MRCVVSENALRNFDRVYFPSHIHTFFFLRENKIHMILKGNIGNDQNMKLIKII